MAPYIFGERNRIHIINLEKTAPMFHEAAAFLKGVVADGGRVLFVGTKRSAREAVQREAVRAGMPFVNQRWLGGMLTNFKTIRLSIKRLAELEEMTANGTLERRGKKEAQLLRREMDKLTRSMGGIKEMPALPDAVFIIDVGHENIAIQEARKLGIPVVAVVDTNCTPEGVDFIIPGNDDAMRAVGLYAAAMADACLEGREAGPAAPGGEDEFIELDEEGKPKARPAPRRPGPDRGRRPGGRRVEASIAPEAGAEEGTADGTRPRPAPVGRRPAGGAGAGGRGRPGGGAGGGRGRPGGGAGGAGR
jgi:small subunit ribosomal protein S2